jgi:hypothetical protein
MGRVLVAPVSFGIGDLVVSLPVIQALINAERRASDQTWLVARSSSQHGLAPRIAGLAGSVDEGSEGFGDVDTLVDLRDHPLQRDFWWGSPAFEQTFGPLGINEILERICADFGIAADFSRPLPLKCRPRPELGNTVLFVVESDGRNKRWPADQWNVAAAELRCLGFSVRQIKRSAGDPPMRAPGIPELLVPTLGDAVDVLTSCSGVIGVDTGLTHIAAQQGTPTVLVCRRTSVYFRPWDHCRVVRGAPCTEECARVEAGYAYNHKVSWRDFKPGALACPSGASCLRATSAEEATVLLREVL